MNNPTENKYRNWVFTINADNEGKLPQQQDVKEWLSAMASHFAFQEEVGEETKRPHYQGCFQTEIRTRQSTLVKSITGSLAPWKVYTKIDRMCGSWEEAYAYCTKSSTKVGPVCQSDNLNKYTGTDVSFLDEKENRYPWQKDIISHLLDETETSLKAPNDREIVWITDKKGNSGKSKLVKYLCYNIPGIVKVSFGSAGQLRSAIAASGAHQAYFIDMPRTLGDDDSLRSLMSVVEDLKNGYVVSTMYGKLQPLMMDPPHIIIFSNDECPVKMLSGDRWIRYAIKNGKELLNLDNIPEGDSWWFES